MTIQIATIYTGLYLFIDVGGRRGISLTDYVVDRFRNQFDRNIELSHALPLLADHVHPRLELIKSTRRTGLVDSDLVRAFRLTQRQLNKLHLVNL